MVLRALCPCCAAPRPAEFPSPFAVMLAVQLGRRPLVTLL